jgi:hypothetical protein
VLILSRRASSEPKQHEERASSEASTVPMPLRQSSPSRQASGATTLAVPSRQASCVTEQHEGLASSEQNAAHVLLVLRMYSLQLHPHIEASASSAHDDHAPSPHQHPATHHHDPASLCTTSASADDFVRTPSDIGVRRMFDLMKTSSDAASPQGAWSNLEENVADRNILRTAGTGAEVVGCRVG